MRAPRSARGQVDGARASEFRNKRRKFYVFCEGKNTEPAYIDHYNSVHAKSPVEVIYCMCGADPSALARAAVEKRRELDACAPGAHDEIWVVFDRDEHEHYHDAVALAASNGIKIAKSNPCIELWLAQHVEFRDSGEGREFWQDLCEEICPGYDAKHGKIPDLDFLIEKVFTAEVNAERLRRAREADSAEFPYTTMDYLTKSIRGARDVAASLFIAVEVSGEVFLQLTAHKHTISIDDHGILDPKCLKECVNFISSRRASLGDDSKSAIERTVNLNRARYALYFNAVEFAEEETYSISDIPDPQCLLLFSS